MLNLNLKMKMDYLASNHRYIELLKCSVLFSIQICLHCNPDSEPDLGKEEQSKKSTGREER